MRNSVAYGRGVTSGFWQGVGTCAFGIMLAFVFVYWVEWLNSNHHLAEANSSGPVMTAFQTKGLVPFSEAVIMVEAYCFNKTGKFCTDVIESEDEYLAAIKSVVERKSFKLSLKHQFAVPPHKASKGANNLHLDTSFHPEEAL